MTKGSRLRIGILARRRRIRRPIEVGPLKIARCTEPFTLLVARLAYEGDRGPELAYRFGWFEK
jgi:hypothetical protein